MSYDKIADHDPDDKRKPFPRCVCGPDLPGHCPGPDRCPLNKPEEEEEAQSEG